MSEHIRTLEGEYCPVSRERQNAVLRFDDEGHLKSFTCNKTDCPEANSGTCLLAQNSP